MFDEYVAQLRYLEGTGREEFMKSVARIYERCQFESLTHISRGVLVVGEVQSGKTASFTGLSALAIDRGIPLVIVLAGTKKPLLEQTTARLAKDLNLNPGELDGEIVLIEQPVKRDLVALENIFLGHIGAVIVTCLKTAAGVRKATTVVDALRASRGNDPILVIDDEGDQAGLNIEHRRGRNSRTYSAILELRRRALKHAYVAYTATPQANLLIDLEDWLSPDFVVVLDSPPSYVGARDLFSVGAPFYRPIPLSEVGSATKPSFGDAPPFSLLQALAYFVCLCIYRKRGGLSIDPISMLIHPHSTMAVHDFYATWTRQIMDSWPELLLEFGAESLPAQLIQAAVEELARSVPSAHLTEVGMDDLSTLISEGREQLLETQVRVLNSDALRSSEQSIAWEEAHNWIVIGGQKLERGYTIENLAVTYMPRGPGGNIADTIQQRGRFFGHKRGYETALRGWLNPDIRDSFVDILDFEESARSELRIIDREGGSLKDWRRRFALTPSLQATREAVVSLDHRRVKLTAGWRFRQERLFDPELSHLRSLVEDTVEYWRSKGSPYPRDNRDVDPDERHHFVSVDLEEVITTLSDWPMGVQERFELDSLLQGLVLYGRRQPHLQAHILLMGNLKVRVRSRDKKSSGAPIESWRIDNLHQGRSGTYPGDGAMRTEDAVTIQIHNVKPRIDRYSETDFAPVLAVAVAWPVGFERQLLLQSDDS